MNAVEMIVISLVTLGRVSALVLFVMMIVNPARFNTRMKVAISIFAFFAMLPVPTRRFLR